MRSRTSTTLTTLLLAATAIASAAPAAFAGADDGGTKAFWAAEANPQPQPPTNNSRYTAKYVEPKQASAPTEKESVPAYFYHAQGTMGVP